MTTVNDLQSYYDLLVKSAGDGTFPSVFDCVCRYREDKTGGCQKRCAVGLLIPDEKYSPELEWLLSDKLFEKLPEIKPDWISTKDLRTIQQCHDRLSHNWSASSFIKNINELPCFANVKRVSC